MIYLDNAATTRIDPIVLDSMLPYLKEEYGNPGTLYDLGRTAKRAIEEARENVAGFLGCDPDQVIFTSGGSESNNTVIRGVQSYMLENGKTEYLTSAVEHDSLINSIKRVVYSDLRMSYNLINPDVNGRINTSCVCEKISDRTGIVSIMYVNNETGTENPIKEICRVCNESGILFHTDCVQAAGLQEINAKEIGCDFLSISSHKIHGPKGVGAVFAKNKTLLRPIISGGANQEFGLRGGTENVAGIVGFGTACKLAAEQREEDFRKILRIKSLFYDALEKSLKKNGVPKNTLSINGDSISKTGKVINLRFNGIDGETMVLALDSMGIYVSAGSACRSHESEPSRVLTAMGISQEDARNSIRVSFSRFNTESEAIEAGNQIANTASALILL